MATEIDKLAAAVAGLQKQVRALSQPQLAYSAIDDGALLSKTIDGAVAAIIGKQWDGTNGAVTVNGPTPPAPAAPEVGEVAGGLRIRWNGDWADGPFVVAPMDFTLTEVHASDTPDFTGMFFATKRREIGSARGGEVTFDVPYDTDMYVGLVARSASGKASTISPIVGPFRALRYSEADIDVDWDAIGGGTTIFAGPDEPTTDRLGDLWLQETIDADGTPVTTAFRWEGEPDGWVEVRSKAAIEALREATAAAQAANDAGITALAAQNAVAGVIHVYKQASAPTGTIPENSLWLDDGGQLSVYRSGAWVLSRDAGINTAIQNAATAQATADGKMRIFAQASPPTGLTSDDVGDMWIDTDEDNKTSTWTGTAWAARLVGNSAIQPNSLVASNVIATGTISGALLSATAIDGKTITGALIRTRDVAGLTDKQRIELDTASGLVGYKPDGSVGVQVNNGVINVNGGTITGATVRTAATGARTEMVQKTTTVDQTQNITGAVRFFSGQNGESPAEISATAYANADGSTAQGSTFRIKGVDANDVSPVIDLKVRPVPAGGYESAVEVNAIAFEVNGRLVPRGYVTRCAIAEGKAAGPNTFYELGRTPTITTIPGRRQLHQLQLSMYGAATSQLVEVRLERWNAATNTLQTGMVSRSGPVGVNNMDSQDFDLLIDEVTIAGAFFYIVSAKSSVTSGTIAYKSRGDAHLIVTDIGNT